MYQVHGLGPCSAAAPTLYLWSEERLLPFVFSAFATSGVFHFNPFVMESYLSIKCINLNVRKRRNITKSDRPCVDAVW